MEKYNPKREDGAQSEDKPMAICAISSLLRI